MTQVNNQNEKYFNFKQLRPGISVDCVIFGFHDQSLKVLVIKSIADGYMLPGGFIPEDTPIDEAALKVLEIRTGLREVFLQQFKTFGSIERVQTEHIARLLEAGKVTSDFAEWCKQRFITIGYYALVEFSKVSIKVDELSESCEWYDIDKVPDLMLDHQEILDTALDTMKKELSFQPIGINLLPKEFTLSELQALYETILEQQLDRRNFRRKMLAYDVLVETGNRRTGGQHKAPTLYRFDKVKYDKANKDGLKGGW